MVVSIIVLLILAGVAIVTLTGENGIINRTISAKNKTAEAEIKENIRLAYQSAKIGEISGETGDFATKFQMELAKVYSNPTVTPGENGTYIVGIREGSYIVNSNGSVEMLSGVNITIPNNKTEIAFLKGTTSQSVQLSAGFTEDLQDSGKTIIWTSLDTSIATVDQTGKVTMASNAPVGTTTIKASAGLGTDGTCIVRVVNSIVDAIINTKEIATLVSSGMAADDNTDVDLVPSNNVEDITYSIVSGEASLTATTGKIHINKISSATATVVVKLKGILSNEERQITINVTKQPEDIDRLTKGTHIKYTAKNPNYNANVEGSTETIEIPCQVLYNDSTHGLQIISTISTETVYLGKSDRFYTTGTDLAKAKNSFNNAIENLNNIAETYQNNSDGGLTLDARCVGSVSTIASKENKNEFCNKDDENLLTNPSNFSEMNKYVMQGYKGTDSHYGTTMGTDWKQMTDEMKNIGDLYWLASRNVISVASPTVAYAAFCVRFVMGTGELYDSNWLWYINQNGSEQINPYELGYGLRPVFLLSSDIKIDSGNGETAETGYVLSAK